MSKVKDGGLGFARLKVCERKRGSHRLELRKSAPKYMKAAFAVWLKHPDLAPMSGSHDVGDGWSLSWPAWPDGPAVTRLKGDFVTQRYLTEYVQDVCVR